MAVSAQVIPMAGGSLAARMDLMQEVQPWLDKTKIRAVGKDILIAMYNRAGKKSSGGIIIAETNREDEFQGKVGLILSLGPMCCEEASPGYLKWFGGQPPKVGEWWGVSVRDGFASLLGSTTCRFVEWEYLRFQTEAPDGVM